MSAAGGLRSRGPLAGLRVVEMPAIGPVPFCGMLLADLGADVLRIDRTGDVDLGLPVAPDYDLLGRGKRSLALDLKDAKAIALALDIIARLLRLVPNWLYDRALARAPHKPRLGS